MVAKRTFQLIEKKWRIASNAVISMTDPSLFFVGCKVQALMNWWDQSGLSSFSIKTSIRSRDST